MSSGRPRYPGAQPFVDDPLSRAVFFGREIESRALADLILAHPLVVVYAKSGVGKTSLLQAGVAQLLRDDGCVPLVVRVNDPKQDPLHQVMNGIELAANRQKFEYHPGSDTSLWHFFKTVEIWRGDHLLTPVLVLDQFEELFTLHDLEPRGAFLRELGYLVRGVRPPYTSSAQDEYATGDTAPTVRIVLSLREDFLGSLEEGADCIPQILDHRFRLSALSVEAATAALEGPSRIKNTSLSTRPFSFKPGAVQSILTYLSRRTRKSAAGEIVRIEPFHLQLVCQRIESIVAARQGGDEEVQVGLADLGSERGLDDTLRRFYASVLKTIEPRRTRKRVRRLCQHFLISPEGRRLSLERGEIRRILKLTPETLAALVDKRLLRSDQRADSWYFELSHDSLILPILATRKKRALSLGGLGLLGSIAVAVLSLVLMGTAAFAAMAPFVGAAEWPADGLASLLVGALMLLSAGAMMMWMSVVGMRRAVETLNRYTAPPP